MKGEERLTDNGRWAMFFTVGIVLVFGIVTIILADAQNGKRNWIDQCLIEQWESTGKRHIGVRDYCLAKYRQTR